MKKSMYILILCTMLTGCVNYETPTATANSNAYETTVSATDFTEETVIETASKVCDATEITEETSIEMTEETTVTATEKASETTQTEVIQTTSETVTTTAITSAEEEKSSITETEITTITEDTETTVITTEITTTTPQTTAKEVTETETVTEETQPTTEVTEPQMSDYEKAVIIYEYMTANGSGTCVQYSYQTYQMCQEYGLECYFTWTENKLCGHVANVVKVEGAWYVLDTQGGCFLRENMCGFTEIVDEYENHVADADIISGVRYG